jgi:hypothetical protein
VPLPTKLARLLLLTAFSAARSQGAQVSAPVPDPDPSALLTTNNAESSIPPIESSGPEESNTPDQRYAWLDSVQDTVYNTLWRTAMHVDRWFGSQEPESAYQKISGSIAPALLWDQYNGFRELVRFHADVPLPQINERFHAFIGRVNPEEFISESQSASGAFANPFAPAPQDQTLLGLQYQEPVRQGARWDAGVGLPVRLSFDPYVKGGYVYSRGRAEQGVLSWRQDLFYRDSQGGFGLTNRLDLQRLFGEHLLLGWTGSTTMAQRSHGWRSYSTLDAVLALRERRALDLQLSIDGITRAPVALHDYGAKLAYRRSVLRNWLVLEVRTSLDWPKDFVWQERKASWGVGAGFELYFGNAQFQARSVTF